MKPSLYKKGDLIQVVGPKMDITPDRPYEIMRAEVIAPNSKNYWWAYQIRDDAQDTNWVSENQIKLYEPGSSCDAGAEEYEEIILAQEALNAKV